MGHALQVADCGDRAVASGTVPSIEVQSGDCASWPLVHSLAYHWREVREKSPAKAPKTIIVSAMRTGSAPAISRTRRPSPSWLRRLKVERVMSANMPAAMLPVMGAPARGSSWKDMRFSEERCGQAAGWVTVMRASRLEMRSTNGGRQPCTLA